MTNRVYVMVLLVVLVVAAFAQAQTFTVLFTFTGSDGNEPAPGVIQDPAGNLYGTAELGGDLNCFAPDGCGVVYKLNTAGTETVLHSFSGADGQWPYTPVARDKAGNIYGTTYNGGSYYWGAVFKIDTAGNETVLYSFTCGLDGCFPYQGLVRDKAGNLYGTTMAGSCLSCKGTIFKIDSTGKFTLLHSFNGGSSNGGEPLFGHLTMDKAGHLYGVTSQGGLNACVASNGCGVLYKLSKNGTFTVLHRFAGGMKDGSGPFGSVVQDKAGNLYGTTESSGSSDYGTIWKVSKKGKETILHNFAGGSSDGCFPVAGVALDSKGNLYGTTHACGANGFGALYELRASGRFTLLHSFGGSDGDYPDGEVLRTAKGTLFGTTLIGLPFGNWGTVWSYVP